ncbi:MAG TPA: amidohydrolase family protein [Acetobacteraceae bacterium]|nr:amidohydrolase family protein [Acetobacteraceae bacterium]
MTKNPVYADKACDLLICNGYVMTLDAERRVFACGAVAITGNSIVAVGTDHDLATRFRPQRVIDAGGAPVHPGMIDPHLHTSTHLCRTAFPDDPKVDASALFAGWFNSVTDEDEYAQALVAAVEMVRNGFTAAMEPGTVFEPDVLVRAAEAVGVRISLSDPFIWDTTAGGNSMANTLKRAPADPKRAQSLLGRQLWRNKDSSGRIHAHVAVYGSGSATEALELEGKRVADANHVVFNQHQNFMPQQTAMDDRRFGGKHALVHFAEIGLLAPNCSFTHLNILRDDEIEPIVKSGMSVVWQPGNYQYYGIAQHQRSRMVELIEAGVNVSLCVDAAKIWTFGDIARIAYLVARQCGGYLSAEQLMEMQTIRAARCLGLESLIGSLEPGKRADIVIRSNALAEAQPNLNAVIQLMLLSLSRSVDTVICNGEIIFRHGTFTRIDEQHVYRLSQQSVTRMLDHLGIAPKTSWPVIT